MFKGHGRVGLLTFWHPGRRKKKGEMANDR